MNDPEFETLLEKSKSKLPGDSFDIWKCMSCPDQPELSQGGMREHLQSVHSIDASTTKGTRQMLMHLDGRTWYQTNYQFDIEGVTLINFCRQRRSRRDPMRLA